MDAVGLDNIQTGGVAMSRRAIFALLGSAVFLGSVAFLVICQSGRYSVSGEDLSVSDEDRLRARFQELRAAIDADDVEAVYSMYPPRVRQQLTLEEYKEERLEDWKNTLEK